MPSSLARVGFKPKIPQCERGGQSDRAPTVIAMGQGDDPGRHRCTGAPARTARRMGKAPRISGRSVQSRLGRIDEPELGRAGDSRDDHPAPLHGLHERLGLGPRPQAELFEAGVQARPPVDPGLVITHEVLEHHGHAGERALTQSTARTRASLLDVEEVGEHRVQSWVHLIDATKRVLDELQGRDLPGSYELGQTHGVVGGELRYGDRGVASTTEPGQTGGAAENGRCRLPEEIPASSCHAYLRFTTSRKLTVTERSLGAANGARPVEWAAPSMDLASSHRPPVLALF